MASGCMASGWKPPNSASSFLRMEVSHSLMKTASRPCVSLSCLLFPTAPPAPLRSAPLASQYLHFCTSKASSRSAVCSSPPPHQHRCGLLPWQVSICTFVLVRQVNWSVLIYIYIYNTNLMRISSLGAKPPLFCLRQYLYFCTSKASKRTFSLGAEPPLFCLWNHCYGRARRKYGIVWCVPHLAQHCEPFAIPLGSGVLGPHTSAYVSIRQHTSGAYPILHSIANPLPYL